MPPLGIEPRTSGFHLSNTRPVQYHYAKETYTDTGNRTQVV